MTADVRVLATDDLHDLAGPADFVDAVREAYRQRGEGAPARSREVLLRQRGPRGLLTDYTAILPGTGAMGGYVYSAGFASQDAWFLALLFDAATGEPRAVLDGAWMNPLKTGAAGAVAADALARGDAGVVGLIGSGRQARGQLRCLATVRDLTEVRVHSPTAAHREAFAEAMGKELGIDVRPVASSRAAIEGADVVVTATRAEEPVFDGHDLADGAHVTAMGQYHPEKREVDVETVRRATYVLDLRQRADRDAGALMAAVEAGAVGPDHVHAELGEVVAGTAPGRRADDEVTLFDSGGTAIETVAAAALLFERAEAEGRGAVVPWTAMGEVHPGAGERSQG